MKKYSMPLGRTYDYPHPAPDRTAFRDGADVFADRTFQVWPNRASMAKSIRMQQRRAHQSTDWHPLVKLGETEGY